MNLVPHIPIINKLFNPKKFEFLAFEGIYCKKGYEDTLHELFNGLLAKNGLKSALMWFGDNSDMYEQLNSYGKLGFLNKLMNKDYKDYRLTLNRIKSSNQIQH